MKKARILCLAVLWMFVLQMPLMATESAQNRRLELDVPREIAEYLPEDLFDMDVSEIYRSFDFGFFTETGIRILASAVPEATKSFSLLLGLLILAAVLHAFGDAISSSALRMTLTLVRMLCLCGAVFSVTETVFTLSETFLETVTAFLSAVTPTMTALMLASGNVTSAAVMSGVITTAVTALGQINSGVIFPLIRISLSVSVVTSVFGMTGVGGVSPLMKKLITYVFGFVTFCLSAVLTFQGIVTKSADSLAIKGVKFAVGSFIPLVGNAVNEALSTIAGGIGAIKAATGVVCAVSVLLLSALPIVKILMHKLFLELSGVAASVLGLDSESKLITEMASFLGYLAAAMTISAVFLILSLSLMAASHV